MGICCGIVGLPNVGKSTFFNGLTQSIQAQAADYPFCTIEPNIGTICVPDERLYQLARIAGSKDIIPNFLQFCDIAGLVKGASQGQGLGNKFLGHIREVDAILHVVRCFGGAATHVEGRLDPVQDIQIIETELMIADLESLERRMTAMEKRYRQKDPETLELFPLYQAAKNVLDKGLLLSQGDFDPHQKELLRKSGFLTAKPVVYVGNISEEDFACPSALVTSFLEYVESRKEQWVLISAQIESELARLSQEEQKEFLTVLGLQESGIASIVRRCYERLDLETFFTIGPKEAHAWTIPKGCRAPQAAACIHTDFQKGFIAVEVVAYEDYIKFQGEQGAKAQGKLRIEGKEYIVQDGDVLHFRFNV
jgi:ribosome-binding ATPase